MVTAIMMAAGKSKRMGKNKLLLPIGRETMIVKTLKEILSADPGEVLVVYHSEKVKEEVSFLEGVDLIYNGNPERGQSESVKIGVRNSHPETRGYFFFAGDQPFLTQEVIAGILKVFKEDPSKIVVPTYNNQRGMPILFPRKYREDLLRVTGDKGGREIIDGNLSDTVFLPIQEEMQGKDIDTYKEYEELILQQSHDEEGEAEDERKEGTD